MIGKAAGWIGGAARVSGQGIVAGSKKMYAPAAVGLIGGSALYGAGSAILDREGPYAPIQETMLGDPEALRASLKAGISGAFDNSRDVIGRGESYYGQPVSSWSPSTSPIGASPDGSMVFGMYNLRR